MFRLGYKLSRFHSAVNNSSSKILNHECPFCKNTNSHFSRLFLQENYQNANISGRVYLSTHIGLCENLKKKKKKKAIIGEYENLIQIGNKNSNTRLERRAKIKKSSPANTLKQFGVTPSLFKKETRDPSSSLAKEKEHASEISKFKRTTTDFSLIAADDTGFIDAQLDNITELNEQIEQEFEVERATAKQQQQQQQQQQQTNKNMVVDKSSGKMKIPTRENDLKNRLEKNLIAFLDVCVHNNMIQQAFDTLRLYHMKHSDVGKPLSDVRLYNCVLEAYALNGNTKQLFRLFELMKFGKVTPNLQSYVYWLEGAYRASEFDKIGAILNKINSNKLNIYNLLTECTFVRNQLEIVLKAIRLKIPDFNPVKPKKPSGYVCKLLQDLNGDKPRERFSNPLGEQLSQQNFQNFRKQQIDVEKAGFMKIRRIDTQSPVDEKTKKLRNQLEEWESTWKSTMLRSYNQRIAFLRSEANYKNSKRTDLLPYLTCLKPDVIVDLMIREFRTIAQFSDSFSPVMMVLHRYFGCKIMDRYHLNRKIQNGIYEQTIKMYDDYSAYISDRKLTSQHISREYWELLKEKYVEKPDIGIRNIDWPTYVLIGVGKFLYEIMHKDMKFDENLLSETKTKKEGKRIRSAIYTAYRKHDHVKFREEIKPNPHLSEFYRLCKPENIFFDANVLPMLCPPIPWTSAENGGYIFAHTNLIRQAGITIKHQLDRLNQRSIQNLYPCIDALTTLGETPWIVNSRVLDVAMSIFNDKGCEELSIPRPISEYPELHKLEIHATKKETAKKVMENIRLKQLRSEMYSLWCDMLYKLSIANAFRDKVMWFPHNLDFRGRVYPVPPHFNHIGNDVCRGILLFAKGEPLGEKGFDWLKIHLINLTGLKKRSSLKERLEYCNEILHEIVDSADKPLTGNGWWKKSDEPWQTLACCMEIAKILKSPDPSTYVCHFPVHQDGSCNGLQHYAALGRDVEGAEQVNLMPSLLPQDVYSRVAEKVEEIRKLDAVDGIEISKLLEGHISRKVVKQPVMTTVYGVTRYGARQQIVRQLKEIPSFSRDQDFKAASYLVVNVFSSLETMFSATKKIQEWFTKSANLISIITKKPVEWVTPIGLPVVQPYLLVKAVTTTKDKKPVIRMEELPVTRKQTNGFPPNYIHSLDSTHMMLTALFCQREGVTFASVHDCFWTHPSTVAKMNKICREQFVALHNEPLLELLSKFFVEKYCGSDRDTNVFISENGISQKKLNDLRKLLMAVPSKGSFDVNKVLKSTYFFS
uniref:DNA-directed RNA polymerase n=1 Tax=Strigamia maritima TaxID=126957 RepID=T1IV89_STRMM